MMIQAISMSLIFYFAPDSQQQGTASLAQEKAREFDELHCNTRTIFVFVFRVLKVLSTSAVFSALADTQGFNFISFSQQRRRRTGTHVDVSAYSLHRSTVREEDDGIYCLIIIINLWHWRMSLHRIPSPTYGLIVFLLFLGLIHRQTCVCVVYAL